jgi:hypothetical protein
VAGWRNWQTQTAQNRPTARSWGFKSLARYHHHQVPRFAAEKPAGRHDPASAQGMAPSREGHQLSTGRHAPCVLTTCPGMNIPRNAGQERTRDGVKRLKWCRFSLPLFNPQKRRNALACSPTTSRNPSSFSANHQILEMCDHNLPREPTRFAGFSPLHAFRRLCRYVHTPDRCTANVGARRGISHYV